MGPFGHLDFIVCFALGVTQILAFLDVGTCIGKARPQREGVSVAVEYRL